MFVFKDTDLTMPEPTTQTSSPQSRYGKPSMGPKETFNLCALGALSVPEQIFLSSCSLSLQETSKPHSICHLSPSWGTSSRPSRAAETLWHFGVTKIDKNTQKLGSVDEILWRVCSTLSSPRDAAGHAPGVCVLHPLYCSLGVTLRGLGEGSGAPPV